MSVFAPATREQMKLRMALQGPAGSGKTLTSMIMARGLVGPDGTFAVIDTEKRAREYAVLRQGDPEGQFTFRFGHMMPDSYEPASLPKLLGSAAAEGYGAVIIDSFSHYWSGLGGALDGVDKYRDKRQGWSAYRPIEKQVAEAILSYPGHVIITMRVKTEYVIDQDASGRSQTRKLGTRADQRDVIDYEFSVIGEMDTEHAITITKTTCQELVDKRILKPGAEFIDVITEWLGQGDPAPDANYYRDEAVNPQATVDDLLTLHAVVKRRSLLNAHVVDDHGDIVPLGDLIVRLGRERKAQTAGVAA